MGNSGPLDGIKVVDLSVMISGPLAAMMLADQGADVIKVESPGLGDIMRFLGTSKGGMTGIFANNNRGKRSIVVDLKQQAGTELVVRLIEGADVLIQNFRPGVVDLFFAADPEGNFLEFVERRDLDVYRPGRG